MSSSQAKTEAVGIMQLLPFSDKICAAYLNAFRELQHSGRLMVPVPVRKLQSFDSFRHLERASTEIEAPPPSQGHAIDDCVRKAIESRSTSVVVTTGCSVAAYFACATNRRLIVRKTLDEGIEEAVGSNVSSLLAFGHPDSFSNEILRKCWSASRDYGLVFGCVPGRSIHEISWWVAKRLLSDTIYNDHLGRLFLTRDDSVGFDADQDATITERAFGPRQASYVRYPLQFLLAELHSKECCARFNSHVFCGLPEQHSIALDSPLNSLPDCAAGAECIWQADRIRVSDVNACHIILISCGSLRLRERLFNTEVGLGLNLFAGTSRSYLSPVRFISSYPLLPGIVADYAMAGTQLGEVAREANRLLCEAGTDADCFVLLGDPEDRIDIPRALEATEQRLDDSELKKTVRNPRTSQSIVPSGFDSGVVLVGDDPLLDSRVRSRIPKQVLQIGRSEADTCDDSHDLISKLAFEDNRSGLWLSLKYEGEHSTLKIRYNCFVCGIPSVCYQRRSTCSSWCRLIVNCPRCGIVADVPKGEYSQCTLTAPEVVTPGERVAFLSRYRFKCDDASFACGFSLIHCVDFGWEIFEDQAVTVSDRGEGVWEAQLLSVVPEHAYGFGYWVRCFWVTSHGLSWMSRPLTVTRCSSYSHSGR